MLMERFGGKVRRVSTVTDRPFYAWTVHGDQAMEVVYAVYDHLIVKKSQAVLVNVARCLPPGSQRDGVVAELTALKHHHYEQKC